MQQRFNALIDIYKVFVPVSFLLYSDEKDVIILFRRHDLKKKHQCASLWVLKICWGLCTEKIHTTRQCIDLNCHLSVVKDRHPSHPLKNSSLIYMMTWRRHRMETFSALLAICAGNSPVPGEFPAQRPVIAVWINGWVNNREAGDLRRYCAHYDVTVMIIWYNTGFWCRHSLLSHPILRTNSSPMLVLWAFISSLWYDHWKTFFWK